jgi:thiamine-phosphate diphosphorylase
VRIEDARVYVIAPARVRAGRLADVIGTLGADIVQLRDKQLGPQELLAEARACADAARRAGCLFIVNDDPELARAAGADGVHLGQDDGAFPDTGLRGRSTHAPEQALAEQVADYLSIGPVWATPTKPGRPAAGIDYVRWAAEHVDRPWFAIGGIDATNVREVVEAGARRIVVVRAITEADDPEAAARELRSGLPE